MLSEDQTFIESGRDLCRPRILCDGYVVIGEAIRPRDILLAGDAHIPITNENSRFLKASCGHV